MIVTGIVRTEVTIDPKEVINKLIAQRLGGGFLTEYSQQGDRYEAYIEEVAGGGRVIISKEISKMDYEFVRACEKVLEGVG